LPIEFRLLDGCDDPSGIDQHLTSASAASMPFTSPMPSQFRTMVVIATTSLPRLDPLTRLTASIEAANNSYARPSSS
jgi:hypothetical protein